MASVVDLLNAAHRAAREDDNAIQRNTGADSVTERLNAARASAQRDDQTRVSPQKTHSKKTTLPTISQEGKAQAVNEGIVLPRASTSPLAGLTILPSSPQQAARDFAYGSERLAAAGLGALEGVTDIINAGVGKAVQGVTSLGGLAPNPVSEWGRNWAETALATSPTQEYEESIRRRYNPTRGGETVTGITQTIAQMLPGIGAARAVSAAGNALNAAQSAQRGANAGRAIFGLQAAGQSAQEARQEGATTNQALAYGAASGLLESTIEGVAGGIPGLGQGRLNELASAVSRSPVLNRAADIAGEGVEEAVSTAITPYLQRAMYNPEAENATPEEILQSAALGSLAAGVLQGGLELPGAVSRAVSDIRDVRQAVGSNQDIINRANQRIQQDINARAAAANPLLTMLPTAEELQARQAGSPAYQRDMRLRLPGGEQQNTASTGENAGEQLISTENMRRYQNMIDGVFTGVLPTGSDIVLGQTPSILTEYGAPELDLHMTQSVARKIAYPSGYMGGKHNLGLSALKNLPYQLADPIAIIENPQSNTRGLASKIVLTEWNDMDGKPVIVPIHLNAQGAIDVQNDVASAFGADYIRRIIGNNGENVLYTKNNEDIEQLLSKGRPLPQAMADDVLARNSILPGGQEVNRQSMAAEDIAPMPLVLPGGAARGSIDNLARPGYDGDTQNVQIGGVTYGRGEEATSAREGIYGTSLQEEIAGPEETHRGRMERVLEESGRAQQPESWAQGHVISTPSAQAQSAASQARKYSRDVFVVDDAALKSRNENAWAVTSGGARPLYKLGAPPRRHDYARRKMVGG